MTALNIDTHKSVRKLREAGMDEKVAEAVIEVWADADTSQLATKADIADLRGEMKDLRTEMWRMQFTTIGATVALVVGLLKLFP